MVAQTEIEGKPEEISSMIKQGSVRLLLHCPDITLKGKNQDDFQRALTKNVKSRLIKFNLDWPVSSSKGRVIVTPPKAPMQAMDEILKIMQQTPGISSLAWCRWLRSTEVVSKQGDIDWAYLEKEIIDLAKACFSKDKSFAIHVNRADKKIPMTSMEMGGRLGGAVRQYTDWDRVNLKRPDQTFHIDIYPDGFYLYGNKINGVGGLPVGNGGKVLSLLSGGIDSPVAAYNMAKRGCYVDFFHLSASHLQQQALEQSVVGKLAAQISHFTGRSRLYVAPYTYFDLALSGKKTGFELVLFRRFMMRTAERLAKKIYAQALVNGDSIGQVASQTLENLVSSLRAVDIPIFQPLIGTNKEEIIKIARHIGTFEISILPYKDCCALIAQQPKTRSHHEKLEEMEQSLLPDYEDIMTNTFKDMICLEYNLGEMTGLKEFKY